MNKKIIAIALVSVIAVPYGAKLLADKYKEKRVLQERLEEVNKKIDELEKSMEKSEELCETGKTNAICSYADEDVSVKGIELERLKRQRKRLQKELDVRNGKKPKKNKKKKKKSKKSKKNKKKKR